MMPAKTDDELKQLARDLHAGRVFTDMHIREPDAEHYARMVRMIFMPLVFMKQEQPEEMSKLDLGMVYEYLDRAGPRSCNGYPGFFSLQLLSRDDTDKVMEYVKKLEEASASL